MRANYLYVLIFIGSMLGSHAHAWGAAGHRVVGNIATSLLTPRARAELRGLIGTDDLAQIATWADENRPELARIHKNSAKWHYVNWPTCSSDDPANFCKGGDCIYTQLRNEYGLISDNTAPRAKRIEALKFFVHFMGDLHQPLHVADNDDAGGNRVSVTYPNATGKLTKRNLHELWDTEIIKEQMRGRSEEDFATELRVAYKDKAKRLSSGGLTDWISETHSVSRKFAYDFAGFNCGKSPDEVKLSREYIEVGQQVANRQLAAAGIRLAGKLNAAFK